MTKGEQATHAAGRWELIDELIDRGLISGRALCSQGRGKARREIREVANRLERAFRRENESGQDQIRKDVNRVLNWKKPRHLPKTVKGRKLRDRLRAIRGRKPAKKI